MNPDYASLGTPERSLPDKVRDLGAAALTDHDLVSLLVGRKQPTGLLRQGLLDLATKPHLHTAALTPTQAARLEAAVEFARRLLIAQRPVRASCRTPEEALPVLLPDLLLIGHEELLCLPLDPHSRLIGQPLKVSRGDVDGTDAGPRAFFRLALSVGATSCIAVHNHPSGDPTPSSSDREVTRRLAAAGRAVDVLLVDHLVIADAARWCSLRRMDPSLFR